MKKKNILFLLLSQILLICSVDLYAVEKKVLKVGIHPSYNPQKTLEIFGPICDLMPQKTSFHCVLEPSKDYSHFNSRIKEKYFDVISPNPLQAVKATEYGYEVFGKWSNDELFKGIILVRKDSGINNVSQLKGKKISFPASTAVAAALLPQFELAEHNLYSGKEYTSMYVGSQDSSILSVFNKITDAGVTWYPPWYNLIKEKPELNEQLKIIYETSELPSNGLLYKSKLTKEEKKEIADYFIHLKDSVEGKELFKRVGVQAFDTADYKTYQPVRDFIKKYNKKIGQVPW